jgi:hypothetical protein
MSFPHYLILHPRREEAPCCDCILTHPVTTNVSYDTSEKIYCVAGQGYYDEIMNPLRHDERWCCAEQRQALGGAIQEIECC